MNSLDTYLRRERLFAGAFLLIVSFNLARSIRHGWIEMCGGFCPVSLDAYQATYAPEAYRIGIPNFTRWMNIAFHFHDGTMAGAIIDFLCSFCALSIFCFFAIEGLSATREKVATRIATLAAFLAFIQFPIGFVFFHQRGETLPTTLFIALALLCLSKAKDSGLWLILLYLATACQSFMQADVPFIFGVAVVLLSLFRSPLATFGSRAANLLRGMGVLLVAGGIQAYLQFIRFPDKHYGPEHAVVFKLNLNPTPLGLFVLALLPFALIVVLLIRRTMSLTPAEAIALTASAIYLPVWFTVGLISEVRIFVPFLLALCVVAARVSTSYLFSAYFSADADVS